ISVAFRWGLASLAAAAAIILALWVAPRSNPDGPRMAEARPEERVAQITASKGCQWAGTNVSARAGEHLRKGQRLDLLRGYAEVTFDSGAQVVLEGPVAFEVNSA